MDNLWHFSQSHKRVPLTQGKLWGIFAWSAFVYPGQPIRDVCSANLEHPLALYSSFQSANQFLLNSFIEIECNLFFYVWLRLRLGWATKCIEDVLSGQSCCKLGSILTSSYCYLPYYRELLPGCKNASDGSSTDRRTTHKTGDKDGREKFDGFFLFWQLLLLPAARIWRSLPSALMPSSFRMSLVFGADTK